MDIFSMINETKLCQKEFIKESYDNYKILEEIKQNINKNIDLIEEAYKIDKLDNKLNKEHLLKQLDFKEALPKYEVFKNEYGKVSNMKVPYGVLTLISNCNPYVILRIIAMTIISGNGLIINLNNNIGINYLLIQNIKHVLSRYNIENLINIYNDLNENIIDREDIDGIIYIGKRSNLERVKIIATKPIIYSGYGNYELYIENELDKEIIEELTLVPDIKIYSTSEINKGQVVKNIEEAILRINESGNQYSASIITESRENAKLFVDNVKSRNIFINISPMLTSQLDIEVEDLMYNKSILAYE